MIANGCALRHNGAGLMRSILWLIAFSLGLFFLVDPAFSNDTDDSWTRGAEAFRLGRFESAVAAWTSAAEQARNARDRLRPREAPARAPPATRQPCPQRGT